MIYKATNLISEVFDQRGLKYGINETEGASMVEAGFEIEGGPDVMVRFISNDDDNDVAVRVFGLMHRIPATKRSVILEACNTLNVKMRFLKFCLDHDSNVNAEVDLPVHVDDDCLGECCFELFARIMLILEKEYHVLAEALYSTPADNEKNDSIEFLKALQALRDNPLVINNEGNQ